MRKRLISICTIVILLYGIYGCAKTDEDVSVAETESVKTENTETESKEADSVDTAVGSEETALSENENGQNKELAEPIYIIEPQLTQDDTYEMQDWQVAYAEYIEGLEWKENYDYSLIYVDDDDIPELVIDTGIEANGCYILTFYNGDVDVFRTARLNFYYIEKQNLINNSDGHMGYYYDSVYSIENGKWVYAAGGVWTETYVMEDDDLVYQYEWEGEPVEEEVYADELNIIFDMEQAKHPEQYERLDEMLFRLQTGTALSQTHRYELYIEDVTWDEARRRCEEKGGYLATITTIEEYEHVKKGIGDSGQTQVAYWVGAYDKYPSSQPVYRWHEPDLDYWDETFISHTFMKKYWADGEPSYCRHADDEQVDRLCVYILYDDATEDCYLYDAPMDMLMRNPGYAGKIGYICEYDSITVMAKETKYYSDGSIGRWSEYEYSDAGNRMRYILYDEDDSISHWYEYEYITITPQPEAAESNQ